MMRIGTAVVFSLVVMLALLVYGQNAPVPVKPAVLAEDSSSFCKSAPSTLDAQTCNDLKELRSEMRDNQWQQSKLTIQMQNLSQQYNTLRDQNNTLSDQLQKISTDALAAAKLDPKQWHVNFDTLVFEKFPAPEKK